MAFLWQDFLNGTMVDPISGLPVRGLVPQAPPGTSGYMPVDMTRQGFSPTPTVPVTPVPGGSAPPPAPVPVPGSAPPLNPSIYHPSRGGAYPGGGKNLYDSPFVRDYLSPLLPEGEYQLRLGRIGMADPNNRAGQFALSQYGNTQRKYQAQQLKNPALSFRDFLRKGGAGDLMNTWRGMTGAQRGLNAPSRTSVIRLG